MDKLVAKGQQRSIEHLNLLWTKVQLPKPRPKFLFRRELLEQLEKGSYRPMTVLCAPAGFGKTSLAVSWIHEWNGKAFWLSLEKNDDQLVRFRQYLYAAFHFQDEQFGRSFDQLLHTTNQDFYRESFGTLFLNELNNISEPFLFVLDDFHEIQSLENLKLLQFLIEHWPPHGHLCLTVRQMPSFPLHRWWARDLFGELSSDELRFSMGESLFFLEQTMSLNLPTDGLKELHRGAEGWAVGLQLSALYLQKNKLQDASQLIEGMSSNEYIRGYLYEEVFFQQPEHIQEFLLASCLFERFSASLLSDVLEKDSVQESLEYVEERNLFLMPLDGKKEWYRYHSLFADTMKEQLKKRSPQNVKIWFLRACNWFAKKDLFESAILYAFQADEFQMAGQLLEKHALEFFRRLELERLSLLLESLPEELLLKNPSLCFYLLWSHADLGKWNEQSDKLSYCFFSDCADEAAEDQNLLEGQRGFLKGLFFLYQGDLTESYQQFESCQKIFEQIEGYDYVASWASIYLAGICSLGDFDQEEAHTLCVGLLKQESAEERRFGYLYGSALLACILCDYRRGHSKEGISLGLQYIEDCHTEKTLSESERILFTAPIHSLLSWLYLENIEFEKAELHHEEAKKGLDYGLDWSFQKMTLTTAAVLLFEKGRVEEAYQFLRKSEDVTSDNRLTSSGMMLNLYQVRMRFEKADPKAALNLLESFLASIEGMEGAGLLASDMLQLKLLTLKKKFIKASELADTLYNKSLERNQRRTLAEVCVYRCIISNELGEAEDALQWLMKALFYAEQGSFTAIFSWFEFPLLPFLQKLQPNTSNDELGCSPVYFRRIMGLFSHQKGWALERKQELSSGSKKIVSILSKREIEVLEVVGQGFTNKAIAKQLFISSETVKKHLKNIFFKLEVRNRTQAVSKARQLGVFPIKPDFEKED